MKVSRRRCLPVQPLLRAYSEAGPPDLEALTLLPEWGPRFRAILAARGGLLSESFLDQAGDEDFLAGLTAFYEACVPFALHREALRRRAGVVRHALGHFLRCPDPVSLKLERCLAPEGPYHVAGLGPSFWSAVVQGIDPLGHPAWTPDVEAGLGRLGLFDPAPDHGPRRRYDAIRAAYENLRSLRPALPALPIDHFLCLVGRMHGRDLFGRDSGPPPEGKRTSGDKTADPWIAAAIRQERACIPLRRRLKERGLALEEARRQLERALAAQDGELLRAAVAVADPAGARRAPLCWKAQGQELTRWVGRLWEADDPWEILEAFWRTDPLPGAGLWLPAAVLHLKQPARCFPWDEASRQGLARLDDGAAFSRLPAERYALFNEGLACLCERHRVHPLEAPAVLARIALGRPEAPYHRPETDPARFGGFCADTFQFLTELGENNCREWLETQRDRYRFAVREPLVELCRALAQRYVEPVLRRRQGWDLETSARSGRALTSICKNDYGRTVPYHTTLWITFCRRPPKPDAGGPAEDPGPDHRKRDEVQFFVRLDRAGLCYGLRIGRGARAAGHLFRRNVQEHAETLYRALADRGAFAECGFGTEEDPAAAVTPTGPGELRAWAGGRTLVAMKAVLPDDPLLRCDDLAGDILLTFDRLLPAFACAVAADPWDSGLGPRRSEASFSEADFSRLSFLSADWLKRARQLLVLKRQLILQGVPGTGKTHVARLLARVLTNGREEAVRLVQFHSAYSYEEFVEGIKVRSVEINGRHDVTYPVEDGLLCAFAAEAARRPAEPHVLIIDEINRGNLPRIFGELLYLLEYREQAVALPYSRRAFRLPANLYLLGTMNAADRSVARVDQALRRRFSFLEMPPDPDVLAGWLAAHPPAEGRGFAAAVVRLFERLNARLATDLGPQHRVGHSYFMVPDLDRARLRAVWDHHVRPLLEEYLAGDPARLAAYELDSLWDAEKPQRPARKRRRAHVSGPS